jgi:hypothetical protein
MKTIALALGGLAAVWMAAPAVAMTARGTIDQRTRASWRETAAASADAAVASAPGHLVVIPSPRRGDLDDRVPA